MTCSMSLSFVSSVHCSVMSDFLCPHGLQHARLPVTPNSQSLLKLMFIKSVMPSHHLILSHPLFLLSSIFPSLRVFSETDFSRVSSLHQVAKCWNFRFSISASSEYSGLISFRIGSFDLLVVQGILICYMLCMLYVTYNTYNIIYNVHIEYVTFPYI